MLIAEDNRVNAVLAARLLSQRGHEVQTVSDGAQAVAAAKAGNIDLILMDVQMPTFDGFEATRLIRAWERGHGGHIPIVAFTANAMTDDVKCCLDGGMDDYLSKPISSERLSEVLARAVAAVARQPFDRAGLRVRLGGDAQVFRATCASFRGTGGELLQAIEASLSAADAGAVALAAANARGALSAMCARASVPLADGIARAATAGDLVTCQPLLEELRRELERLTEALAASSDAAS